MKSEISVRNQEQIIVYLKSGKQKRQNIVYQLLCTINSKDKQNNDWHKQSKHFCVVIVNSTQALNLALDAAPLNLNLTNTLLGNEITEEAEIFIWKKKRQACPKKQSLLSY